MCFCVYNRRERSWTDDAVYTENIYIHVLPYAPLTSTPLYHYLVPSNLTAPLKLGVNIITSKRSLFTNTPVKWIASDTIKVELTCKSTFSSG